MKYARIVFEAEIEDNASEEEVLDAKGIWKSL